MTTLSYVDIGQGTPIVCIHGLGGRKEAWVHQNPLSHKYRLILVDLRGHGETVKDDELTVANFASDVIELLEYLEIKQAFICGLSLGGIVAQELYTQRADLVAGLILANTTSLILPYYTHGMIQNAEKAFKEGTLLDDIVARGLVNKVYEEDARKAFLIRDSYMESAKAAIGLNYFPSLYHIKKPVLLIGSAQDQVIPIANLHLMECCIKNVRTVIFNQTGHLSNIEQAATFNEVVDQFVSEHTSS